MKDKLRVKMVELVSKLHGTSEETRKRGEGKQPAVGSHDYWLGVSFGLQTAVGETLSVIEDLTQSGEDGGRLLDDLHANLVEMAAKLYRGGEDARKRSQAPTQRVASPDYWQGVAFGLSMAVGEILTQIEVLTRKEKAEEKEKEKEREKEKEEEKEKGKEKEENKEDKS